VSPVSIFTDNAIAAGVICRWHRVRAKRREREREREEIFDEKMKNHGEIDHNRMGYNREYENESPKLSG